MLNDRIEAKWIDLFAQVFALCKVAAGRGLRDPLRDAVARPQRAARRTGAGAPGRPAVPRRGADAAPERAGAGAIDRRIGRAAAAGPGGRRAGAVGLRRRLHRRGPAARARAARDPEGRRARADDLQRASRGARTARARPRARSRRSRPACGCCAAREPCACARPPAPTSSIDVEDARVGGVWGYTERPGSIAHWPGGLCLCFPGAGSVNGALVMAPGDVNLTFKRYLESADRADDRERLHRRHRGERPRRRS